MRTTLWIKYEVVVNSPKNINIYAGLPLSLCFAIGNMVFTMATVIQFNIVGYEMKLGWTVYDMYIHVTGPQEKENTNRIHKNIRQINIVYP